MAQINANFFNPKAYVLRVDFCNIVRMIAEVQLNSQKVKVNLSMGIDLTLPVRYLQNGVNAYGLTEPVIKPFRFGNLVGSIAEGGSVNCEDILFNPHGNGTHTECYGHISKERVHVIDLVKMRHLWANLVSVQPEIHGKDLVISKESLSKIKINKGVNTLIIRTIPNALSKKTSKYSGTNPPYFSKEAMTWIVEQDIMHLMVDLPSVDKEVDNGVLETHHIFWNYPARPRKHATITELIFVPDHVKDGLYFVNLQLAPIESDASPSTIIIYPVNP